MESKNRLQLLYTALIVSHNALFLQKFAYASLANINPKLKTFETIFTDAYYSIYGNLAIVFDKKNGVKKS